MKIQVTRSHINRGERGQNKCCPVALALLETKRFPYVSVNGIRIHTSPGSSKMGYELNEKIQKFIEKFDMGFYVYPFEFDLDELETF